MEFEPQPVKRPAKHSSTISSDDRFISLRAKILGFETHLVDPKYYASPRSFDLWFHAAHEFDIFAMTQGHQLTAASVEIDDFQLDWKKGSLNLRNLDSAGAGGNLTAPESETDQYFTTTLNRTRTSSYLAPESVLSFVLEAIRNIEYEPEFFEPLIHDLVFVQKQMSSGASSTHIAVPSAADRKFSWSCTY